MAEKQYLITEKLANDIVNYLAKHPYGEVFQMVDKLRTMAEAPEARPAPGLEKAPAK